MIAFQVYVRQRLAELEPRMPARPDLRESAELAFLEREVVQGTMSVKKRQLRDPLRNVPASRIDHTELQLLSRFVSEAGAILPRKLTGVKPYKQRRLTKALKRAHQLALLPRTWKLPKYRGATYAADNHFKQPVANPSEGTITRADDDEFHDPPDIRYPNRWDRKPLGAHLQLGRQLLRHTKPESLTGQARQAPGGTLGPEPH